MKKLLIGIALFAASLALPAAGAGSAATQAAAAAPLPAEKGERERIAQDKQRLIDDFFDPLLAKQQSCEYMRQTVDFLSCSLDDVAQGPCLKQRGKISALPILPANPRRSHLPGRFVELPPYSAIIFQMQAMALCSFECSAGQRMCDETLNPDSAAYQPRYERLQNGSQAPERRLRHQACAAHELTDGELELIEQTEWRDADEDGEAVTVVETQYQGPGAICSEIERFLLVCDEICRQCQKSGLNDCERQIREYSEEWIIYKERQKEQEMRAKHEASCFAPTAADCRQIESEKRQCLLEVAEEMKEEFCSSPNPIWIHRQERKYFEEAEIHKR